MKVVRILFNILAGIIGAAMLVVVGGHFGLIDSVKPYIVQSGSMAPAIPLGSVVLVRAATSYTGSDVISFHPDGNKTNVFTHRVVFKLYPNGISGEPTYLTMGDANKDIDRYRVKGSDIVGKVYFAIPYLGYAVDFARTPKGFILLVIVPATIIVYEELRAVIRELAKLWRQRRGNVALVFENLTPTSTSVSVGEERGLPKAMVALPLVGVALVFVAVTASYFLDSEMSANNIMSAAVSFTTASPTVTPTPTLLTPLSPQLSASSSAEATTSAEASSSAKPLLEEPPGQ